VSQLVCDGAKNLCTFVFLLISCFPFRSPIPLFSIAFLLRCALVASGGRPPVYSSCSRRRSSRPSSDVTPTVRTAGLRSPCRRLNFATGSFDRVRAAPSSAGRQWARASPHATLACRRRDCGRGVGSTSWGGYACLRVMALDKVCCGSGNWRRTDDKHKYIQPHTRKLFLSFVMFIYVIFGLLMSILRTP
jgi:hypothetical protein